MEDLLFPIYFFTMFLYKEPNYFITSKSNVRIKQKYFVFIIKI